MPSCVPLLCAGLYAFLGEVFEFVGVEFPVAPVEIPNVNPGNRFRFEAADIDTDAIRVGARDVERFDAAVGAETVPGDAGIEGVGGEVILSLQEVEAGGGHDQVEVGGH